MQKYDKLIEAKGGIDLQVLGIGQNAHIGFNEPDIKFEATTHKVKLDEETIKANSRFLKMKKMYLNMQLAWVLKLSCSLKKSFYLLVVKIKQKQFTKQYMVA